MQKTVEFNKLKKHLQENKEKIAFLALTSKLEDYLVKEHVYILTRENNVIVYTNYGKTNSHEPRRDICLLEKNGEKGKIVRGFIEAKYVTNIHRDEPDHNAQDDIRTPLRKLHNQLQSSLKTTRHYGYDVKLYSKNRYVYGVVFSVWKMREGHKNDTKEYKENFFKKIKNIAEECNLKHPGKPKEDVRLSKIFDDVPVETPMGKFKVSLRIGIYVSGGKPSSRS